MKTRRLLVGVVPVGGPLALAILPCVFTSRPPAPPPPIEFPAVYKPLNGNTTRVYSNTRAIGFTGRNLDTGETTQVYARLHPVASVKVDGAEVRMNAEATIIARIETTPDGRRTATVTGIAQPP